MRQVWGREVWNFCLYRDERRLWFFEEPSWKTSGGKPWKKVLGLPKREISRVEVNFLHSRKK
jgi:hypothetical protein